MPELTSGTITFLLADIESSTALWEQDRAARRRDTVEQLGLAG